MAELEVDPVMVDVDSVMLDVEATMQELNETDSELDQRRVALRLKAIAEARMATAENRKIKRDLWNGICKGIMCGCAVAAVVIFGQFPGNLKQALPETGKVAVEAGIDRVFLHLKDFRVDGPFFHLKYEPETSNETSDEPEDELTGS